MVTDFAWRTSNDKLFYKCGAATTKDVRRYSTVDAVLNVAASQFQISVIASDS